MWKLYQAAKQFKLSNGVKFIFTKNPMNGRQFHFNVKMAYKCSHCQNKWTSMEGFLEAFAFPTRKSSVMIVHVTIYGQKCHTCKNKFEKGSVLDADYILDKMYQRLINKTKKSVPTVAKKQGHPKANHQKQLCQACALGKH